MEYDYFIYYRRGATKLTPERIEKIRTLKNQAPTYAIVNKYHIRSERILDIWNNSEQLQQDVKCLPDLSAKGCKASPTSKSMKISGTRTVETETIDYCPLETEQMRQSSKLCFPYQIKFVFLLSVIKIYWL